MNRCQCTAFKIVFVAVLVATLSFSAQENRSASAFANHQTETKPDDTLINDFEKPDEVAWWVYGDLPAGLLAAEPISPGYESAYALQFTIDIPAQSYAGTNIDIENVTGWATASGLRFMWRADTSDLWMSVTLFAGDTYFQRPFEKSRSGS